MFALRIVPDVLVTHSRQLPGGFFGGRSHGVHAVDDYFGAFVGEYVFGFADGFEGQVDRAGKVRLPVIRFVQNVHEHEVVPAVHLLL